MGDGLLAFVREDAYFKVFKAFAAGRHDLSRELMLSKLRKELDIDDSSHTKLRQMVMDGHTLQQKDYEVVIPSKKTSKPLRPKQTKRERARTPDISDDDELDYVPVKATHSRPPELSSRPSRPAKRPKKESMNGLDSKVAGLDGQEINRLIGYKVQRFWPEYGGWWDGVITDFQNGEHCIVYDINTPKESFEWYDISIARNDEFQVSNEKIDILAHAKKSHPSSASNAPRKPSSTNHFRPGGGRGSQAPRRAGQNQFNQGSTNGHGLERRVSGHRGNVAMPSTPFVIASESESSTSDSDSS